MLLTEAMKNGHFYASSVAEWRTDADVEALLKFMRRAGHAFNLYLVPLPASAEYEIKSYAPQVEGATFLGYYAPAEAKTYRVE